MSVSRNSKKRKIVRIFFCIWVCLWLHGTFIRGAFYKHRFEEYREIFLLSMEGKKAYLLGKDLYDFIQFCKKHLPPASHYLFVGMDSSDIRRVRAVYDLFPHYEYLHPVENDPPDYILVYNLERYSQKGYRLFMKLDDQRYILKNQNEHTDS